MLKLFSAFALIVTLAACTTVLADNPKIINLSSSEKAQAMAILERRQAISIKRQKL